MRWIIVAFSLLLPCSANSAIYTFNVVSEGGMDTANGFITFATPASAMQSVQLTADVTSPLAGATFIESITGTSFNGSIVIDSHYESDNALAPLDGSFLLGEGTTKLVFFFRYISQPGLTATFTLDVPDELTPSAVTSIPEASTWAMMLIGFAGIAMAGSRNFRRLASQHRPYSMWRGLLQSS